jgi:hypothetical protein
MRDVLIMRGEYKEKGRINVRTREIKTEINFTIVNPRTSWNEMETSKREGEGQKGKEKK